VLFSWVVRETIVDALSTDCISGISESAPDRTTELRREIIANVCMLPAMRFLLLTLISDYLKS
jgi:hypothetical protein